jgi:hypothetical protein
MYHFRRAKPPSRLVWEILLKSRLPQGMVEVRAHSEARLGVDRITPANFPRKPAVTMLAVLVLLIGFSRIFLGVHFLSDVIGSYATAIVWLTFCILMTHRTQSRAHVSQPGLGRQP